MEENNESRISQQSASNGNNFKKVRGLLIFAVIISIAAFYGYKLYKKSKTHITTDNAFIESNIIPVSFKVSGTLKAVFVKENQMVKKGELIAEIDDTDYRIKFEQADAGVGIAMNETGGEEQQVNAAKAQVDLAKARHQQSNADLKRAASLTAREVLPKEQFEKAETAEKIAASQLREAEEGLKRARSIAGLASNGGSKAKIRQRVAQREELLKTISYTKIYAPANGIITKKNAEPGANIQAGQPLMALVEIDSPWVIANYKESQIAAIRPGKKVVFTVDSYPNKVFHGTVESIMAGTGAAFSLLPPENATGNYVKVVQRIPVKISIDKNSDPEHLLRIGMSVVPSVLVNEQGK